MNSNELGGTVAERNKKLVKLLNGIAGINFGINHETAIDAFGDTYEYRMGMYVNPEASTSIHHRRYHVF